MRLASPICLLLCIASPVAQTPPPAAAANDAGISKEQRLANWREDLAFLTSELPAKHKNAFFHCSKADFEAAVAALERDLPALQDHQIIVRLMQLVAKLGDFHTGIGSEALPKPWSFLPIAFTLFADGPVIVAAREAQRDLIGCTLVQLGGVPIDEALHRAASVAGCENEATFKSIAPRQLVNGLIAHALGLCPAPDRAAITVRDGKGSERTVELTALSPGEKLAVGGPQGAAQPLYRQQRPTANWFEPLPEQHAVYFHYWRCTDDPGRRVVDVGEDVLEAIEADGVSRLVVDLRGNGGGNSALLMPFIQRLASRKNVNRPGGIVVLVGRGTFSSAHLNAVSLHKDLHAVLIGEPTGQKPNAYGEVKTFKLPHSQIEVRYSTKFWQTEDGDRPSMEPDVRVEPSSADFLAGRDPVLAAALAYEAK